MTAGPPDRLEDLAGHVLDRLRHAAERRDGPWRTPMLATVAPDGAPALRTVVLRAVDPGRRALAVYTNRRSDKAAQLTVQPKVELGFWDPAAAEQLRVAGSARTLVDGPEVDRAWQALPADARRIYLDRTAPGTPLRHSGSSGLRASDPRHEVFAVIEIVWERWDWLWLGPGGHRRARVQWSGGTPRCEWVEP